MIEDAKRDPNQYYNRQARSVTSNATTLNRMLEGVITLSRQDQLDEFIELERTLETEISDALMSEPGIASDSKPPLTTNPGVPKKLLNLNL